MTGPSIVRRPATVAPHASPHGDTRPRRCLFCLVQVAIKKTVHGGSPGCCCFSQRQNTTCAFWCQVKSVACDKNYDDSDPAYNKQCRWGECNEFHIMLLSGLIASLSVSIPARAARRSCPRPGRTPGLSHRVPGQPPCPRSAAGGGPGHA